MLFNRLMADEENYPEIIAAIVERLLHDDREGATLMMAGIASPARQPGSRRRSPSRALKIQVWRRDHWTCLYCGAHTIFYPVMPLLGAIFPDHFPWNTYWRAGQTRPAVTIYSSVIDHVVPVALGGESDETNLATACARCNSQKGDRTLEQLGWQRLEIDESTSWDGLSGFYQ